MIDLLGLTFVVATDAGKTDADTRKLIRSHVMVGKNAGRILSNRGKQDRRGKPGSAVTVREKAENPYPAAAVLALSQASRRFGSRKATFPLADENVDPSMINSVLRLSAIVKQILFPLEPCIFFERRAEEWIGPLSTDPVYLHCLIFTAQYYFDAKSCGSKGSGVPVNHRTMPHFVKGLRMLGERISNENDTLRLRSEEHT